jgi:hypothetical protein
VNGSDLPEQELTAAGAAFADVHNWAGSAWRSLSAPDPAPTRKSVLATIDELTARLAEVRELLDSPELPSVTEGDDDGNVDPAA